MRNTLLTTTALVLTAGIASADGHATLTWSGTATAGMARDGKVEKVAATAAAVVNAAGKAVTATAASAGYFDGVELRMKARLAAVKTAIVSAGGAAQTMSAGTTVALLRADIALLTAANKVIDATGVSAQAVEIKAVNDTLNVVFGKAAVAEVKTGKFKTYSEVNATVTGSVVAGGVTVSAAMSVDAGTGYTFASDKTFDGAKTNGVSLDNVTIDMGAMGVLKLDENAVAHLVDGDDDAAADLLYTNTLGLATLSVAIDAADGDVDTAPSAAVADTVTYAADATTTTFNEVVLVSGAAAVAADVQWSAKVSMPVGNGTVYAAIDEAEGNAFGLSGTMSGLTLSIDSKLEALGKATKAKRDTTMGVGYTVGAVKTKATYNTLKDGDQWGVSATYAADGTSITASTDEGSDWILSGSYLLGTGASVVGGINYTEDAYLGLSFSF